MKTRTIKSFREYFGSMFKLSPFVIFFLIPILNIWLVNYFSLNTRISQYEILYDKKDNQFFSANAYSSLYDSIYVKIVIFAVLALLIVSLIKVTKIKLRDYLIALVLSLIVSLLVINICFTAQTTIANSMLINNLNNIVKTSCLKNKDCKEIIDSRQITASRSKEFYTDFSTYLTECKKQYNYDQDTLINQCVSNRLLAKYK